MSVWGGGGNDEADDKEDEGHDICHLTGEDVCNLSNCGLTARFDDGADDSDRGEERGIVLECRRSCCAVLRRCSILQGVREDDACEVSSRQEMRCQPGPTVSTRVSWATHSLCRREKCTD